MLVLTQIALDLRHHLAHTCILSIKQEDPYDSQAEMWMRKEHLIG